MKTTLFLSAYDANTNTNGIPVEAEDERGIYMKANDVLADMDISNFYAWSGNPASGRIIATYGTWD